MPVAVINTRRTGFDRPAETSDLRGVGELAGDVLAFAIPAANFFALTAAGGSIPGGEFIVALFFPIIMLLGASRLTSGVALRCLLLIAVWFVASFISNIANGSDPSPFLKGQIAIAAFGVDTITIVALIGPRIKRFKWFMWGTLLGTILRIYFGNSDFVNASASVGENWKFGWAIVVSIAAAIGAGVFYARRRYVFAIGLVVICGGLNLVFDARSAFLISLLSIVLVTPFSRSTQDSWMNARLVQKATIRRFITTIALLVVGSALLGYVYSWAARSGALGYQAQAKYEQQAGGKYGTVIGGRPEVIPEAVAIYDAPFLGHGSYPEDPKYVELLNDALQEGGYQDEGGAAYGDADLVGIPVHSQLAQGWVWSGIGGALVWLYLLQRCLRAVLVLAFECPPYAPLAAYVLTNEFWAILFSPFGLERRIENAGVIALLVIISQRAGEPLAPEIPPQSSQEGSISPSRL